MHVLPCCHGDEWACRQSMTVCRGGKQSHHTILGWANSHDSCWVGCMCAGCDFASHEQSLLCRAAGSMLESLWPLLRHCCWLDHLRALQLQAGVREGSVCVRACALTGPRLLTISLILLQSCPCGCTHAHGSKAAHEHTSMRHLGHGYIRLDFMVMLRVDATMCTSSCTGVCLWESVTLGFPVLQ